MSSDGTADVIGVFPAQPTYKELENAVREVNLHALPLSFSYLVGILDALSLSTLRDHLIATPIQKRSLYILA